MPISGLVMSQSEYTYCTQPLWGFATGAVSFSTEKLISSSPKTAGEKENSITAAVITANVLFIFIFILPPVLPDTAPCS